MPVSREKGSYLPTCLRLFVRRFTKPQRASQVMLGYQHTTQPSPSRSVFTLSHFFFLLKIQTPGYVPLVCQMCYINKTTQVHLYWGCPQLLTKQIMSFILCIFSAFLSHHPTRFVTGHSNYVISHHLLSHILICISAASAHSCRCILLFSVPSVVHLMYLPLSLKLGRYIRMIESVLSKVLCFFFKRMEKSNGEGWTVLPCYVTKMY